MKEWVNMIVIYINLFCTVSPKFHAFSFLAVYIETNQLIFILKAKVHGD